MQTERYTSAEAAFKKLLKWAEVRNVAEELDEQELDELAMRCVREYEIDLESRTEWEAIVERAQKRADMESEDKNYPFEGASAIKYPILAQASLQFAARAYGAIIPGSRVVRGKIVGDDPDGQKKAKATRISEHMSYQVLDDASDWEEDTDTMLHRLPIVGCEFRQVWQDKHIGRWRSETVTAMDFVVNNATRNLNTVPRASKRFELYPHEIEDRVADGTYLDNDYDLPADAGEDEDALHEFIEQHRLIDLDGDGYREPWIVTIHLESQKIAAIVPNYDVEDLELYERKGKAMRLRSIPRAVQFIKYSFLRDHKGGFYDLGFGKVLESLSEVIDTTLNQMADAAHLQNAGGGFIGSGLRLKKQHLRMEPGKYHVVQASGSKVREAIYNMEHPGPSAVSFQLLEMLLGVAEKLGSIQDALTGDIQKNIQPTTLLAMIEQGQKQYTAIYKRIYRALSKEFKLLFELNAKHLDEQEYFTVMDTEKAIAREDYNPEEVDLVPVSDPNMVSDMQRLARAQVIFDVATNDVTGPITNTVNALRRYYDAAGVEDVDELIQEPQMTPDQAAAADRAVRGEEAQIAEVQSKAQKNEAEAMSKLADSRTKENAAKQDTLVKMEQVAEQRRKRVQDGMIQAEQARNAGQPA